MTSFADGEWSDAGRLVADRVICALEALELYALYPPAAAVAAVCRLARRLELPEQSILGDLIALRSAMRLRMMDVPVVAPPRWPLNDRRSGER